MASESWAKPLQTTAQPVPVKRQSREQHTGPQVFRHQVLMLVCFNLSRGSRQNLIPQRREQSFDRVPRRIYYWADGCSSLPRYFSSRLRVGPASSRPLYPHSSSCILVYSPSALYLTIAHSTQKMFLQLLCSPCRKLFSSAGVTQLFHKGTNVKQRVDGGHSPDQGPAREPLSQVFVLRFSSRILPAFPTQ